MRCLPYEKQNPHQNYLATQTTSANWHSNKAEKAAVCCTDWWRNMKGSLPSPIVWLFNQTQASVVGWHQYAWRSPVTTSPRFCVKRHSLSVFLCLSRCYPSVHRWALQKSGPLHLIYISLSKRKQRNSEEKSICCKISLCRLCFNLFLIFFFPNHMLRQQLFSPYQNKQSVWRLYELQLNDTQFFLSLHILTSFSWNSNIWEPVRSFWVASRFT